MRRMWMMAAAVAAALACWLKGDGSAQHDYLYSSAELASAIPELRRLEQESERVLVFMNNPWRGQAVINARMLMDQLQPLFIDRS